MTSRREFSALSHEAELKCLARLMVTLRRNTLREFEALIRAGERLPDIYLSLLAGTQIEHLLALARERGNSAFITQLQSTVWFQSVRKGKRRAPKSKPYIFTRHVFEKKTSPAPSLKVSRQPQGEIKLSPTPKPKAATARNKSIPDGMILCPLCSSTVLPANLDEHQALRCAQAPAEVRAARIPKPAKSKPKPKSAKPAKHPSPRRKTPVADAAPRPVERLPRRSISDYVPKLREPTDNPEHLSSDTEHSRYKLGYAAYVRAQRDSMSD